MEKDIERLRKIIDRLKQKKSVKHIRLMERLKMIESQLDQKRV